MPCINLLNSRGGTQSFDFDITYFYSIIVTPYHWLFSSKFIFFFKILFCTAGRQFRQFKLFLSEWNTPNALPTTNNTLSWKPRFYFYIKEILSLCKYFVNRKGQMLFFSFTKALLLLQRYHLCWTCYWHMTYELLCINVIDREGL